MRTRHFLLLLIPFGLCSNAGIRALLVRRPGTEGEGEHKEPDEDLSGISVVSGLSEVVDEVLKSGSGPQSFQASA